MKRSAAWWWIDRWRKSTAYVDMSAEEQGVYRNLLDELWLRGGVIPLDDRALAKISGDPEAWPRVRDVVLARFDRTPEGYRNETHDEVSAWSGAQAKKGRTRAARAPRKGGRFTSRPPADLPADLPAEVPAGHQPEPPAQHQPPYSYSYSTPLTEERKNGPTSQPTEIYTPKANPLVADRRDALREEILSLCRQIGERDNLDPAEVLAKGSHYHGAKRQKINPWSMSDDLLLNTVLDLRATWDAGKAGA